MYTDLSHLKKTHSIEVNRFVLRFNEEKKEKRKMLKISACTKDNINGVPFFVSISEINAQTEEYIFKLLHHAPFYFSDIESKKVEKNIMRIIT